MKTARILNVDGVSLALVLERKRVKHVNARLHESTLTVSAPAGLAPDVLDKAITDLARRLLRRRHARQANAEESATTLAQVVAARFPRPPAVAAVEFVATQRARWGSYSARTGAIRLSTVLRGMPRWVLEAVVAHELAHVEHPNHSPRFWELLRRVCPDTDRARAFLAGVTWLARRWPELPPVERAILSGDRDDDGDEGHDHDDSR